MASTRTRHAPRTATVKQDASSAAGVVLVEAGVVVVVEPPGTVVVGAPGVVVVDVVGPGPVFGAVVELVEPAGMVDVVDVGAPATPDDVAGSSPPVVNTPTCARSHGSTDRNSRPGSNPTAHSGRESGSGNRPGDSRRGEPGRNR